MSGLSVKTTPGRERRSGAYDDCWLWLIGRIVADKRRSRRGFIFLVPLIGRVTSSCLLQSQENPPSFGILAALAIRDG